MKWLWILMMVFAVTASAADVTGTWKGSIDGPNGKIDVTMVLKADGDKVTGTYSSQMGEAPIADGKLDGDNISFSVTRNFNGDEFKLTYKGKVGATEMKLTVSFPGGDQTFELIARKTQ